MGELAISGAILAIISLALMVIGWTTGRMPLNERLDTGRDTAPKVFWALFAFWMLVGLLGLAILIRHLEQ